MKLSRTCRNFLKVRFSRILSNNDGGVWGQDPNFDGHDTVVLRSTDQNENGQWCINEPALRKLSASDRLRTKLLEGDLVMTKSSGSQRHIGKTTIVGEVEAELGASFSNFMQRFRIKSPNSSRYFWFVIQSHEFRDELLLRSTTSTGLANITGGIAASISVPLPNPSEQRVIADFLDRETAEIDAFIADQERLIELLDERRAATITQAVTKGLDPTVPMKDSGIDWLGNVPESWAIAPLKWISQLVTGTTPSTTEEGHYTDNVAGFPWIRPEDIDESGRPTVASKTLSSTGRQLVRTLPPKTVLLVCIGATLGKVGITADKTSTNQQITAIHSKSLESKYLFFTMQAAYPEIRLAATGTTLPILNSSRLGSLRLPLPSEKEQQIISKYLERETSAIDAAVADAREAITLSRERRAALISAAVTGQLDVFQAQSRGSVGEMLERGVRV